MVTDELVNSFKDIGDRLNEHRLAKAQKPTPQTPPAQPDEDIEKWRKTLLKILVILVGGLAAVLIIIRIVSRFI